MKKLLLVLTISFLFLNTAYSDVSIDNEIKGSSNSITNGVCSFEFTVEDNASQVLIVGVGVTGGPNVAVSSVNFNDKAMTQSSDSGEQIDYAEGNYHRAYVYYTIAPDAGTFDIDVNVNMNWVQVSTVSCTIYGVKQQVPEVTGGNKGYGTTSSKSLTTITDGAFVYDFTLLSAGITATSDTLTLIDGATTYYAGYQIKETAGASTNSWTLSTAGAWVNAGFAFQKSVGAGVLDHHTVSTAVLQFTGIGFSGTVQAYDADGNKQKSDSNTVVTLTSSSGNVVFYTDGDYDTPTTTYTLSAGAVTFYAKDATSESTTITATSTGPITGTSSSITVGSNVIDHYDITATTPQDILHGWSETVSAKNAADNTITCNSSAVVTITSPGTATFYTNANYNVPTTTYTLTNGVVTIYVKDPTQQTMTIIASDGTKQGTSGNIVVNDFSGTTYYVRTDGGTATQCTGLADAAYDGSGTGEACAWSSPVWGLGVPYGALNSYDYPQRISGGDTIIIDGIDHSTGLQAQYRFGTGIPLEGYNETMCEAYNQCTTNALPSGIDTNHPTRILGKDYADGCHAMPQLWGYDVRWILNLSGASYIDLRCLEITDHSNGFFLGYMLSDGDTPQNGGVATEENYAMYGIQGTGPVEYVHLEDLNIHGLGHAAIFAGGTRNWSFKNVKMVANAYNGWDQDTHNYGGTTGAYGLMTMDNVLVEYNGCGETYPGLLPHHCFDQFLIPGGSGDGIAFYGNDASWEIKNSSFSHNLQEGFDCKYGRAPYIHVDHSTFEGNTGYQFVGNADEMIMSNSKLIGNCAYMVGQPFASAGVTGCRVPGSATASQYIGAAGQKWYFLNDFITGNVDALLTSGNESELQFHDCDGTEVFEVRNSIIIAGFHRWGQAYWNEPTPQYHAALWYNNGYDGNGAGACGNGPTAVTLRMYNSITYQTKYGSADALSYSPDNSSIDGDPGLNTTFEDDYQGASMDTTLAVDSPARGLGINLTSLYPDVNNLGYDFNYSDRGAGNWDGGAIQYGSEGSEEPEEPAPSGNTLTGALDFKGDMR